MNPKKIITVVGARPQFIKAAALNRALNASEMLDEVMVHSGQHYDHELSENFFLELNIPRPKYNLGVGSAPHNIQIAQCLLGLEKVFTTEKPDMVVVFGDTNTTAAAAIAAAKRNIPLAHVEAGLREFDKSIPEETNKRITDAVTDLYFTPTETGRINLQNEGITDHVYVTGDISLDLLTGNTMYVSITPFLEESGVTGPYVFMTCHREMITGNRKYLTEVLESIKEISYPVIFPIHPRTRKALKLLDMEHHLEHKNIYAIEPIGFWLTQSLIRSANFVITDSGGIIKESYFHKVPAIIIDKQTEWIETVREQWHTITGPDKRRILEAAERIERPTIHTQALGDGTCGRRIVKIIEDYLY